jgi:arylsulfatase A-like enzyme
MQRPNVVWVTIDSVRADHTSIHGYERDTTPNLATIGREGVIFQNCVAHSVATAASTASIVTGTYPSKHQVAMGEAVGKIPDELDTAAELFSEAGYRTACVTTNPRLRLVGADAGFDTFHDVSRSTLLQPSNLKTTAKFLANLWSHSVGLSTDGLAHSFSLVINDLATRWVESLPDEEPFFLYVHYNEPHRPYLPPKPWQDRYIDCLDVSAAEAADIATDLHENAVEYIADGLPLSPTEWAAVKAMYDAEIVYTDKMVGRLFETVGAAEDTSFVATADHGELLGEGGLFGHLKTVIDPLVHVPAVADGIPGVENDIGGVVQHADMMKTLLEVAGGRTAQFEAAVDLRSESRKFAVSQEHATDYAVYEEFNESFDPEEHLHGGINALRTEDFKLVTHEGGYSTVSAPKRGDGRCRNQLEGHKTDA